VKKTINMFLVVMLMLSLCTVALADIEREYLDTKAIRITPPEGYTEKDSVQSEKEAKEKDDMLFKWLRDNEQSHVKGDPDGEYYFIDVEYFPQETHYWCGPASVQQSLGFHKVESGSERRLPSQATLAEQSGTTKKGAWTENLRNTINLYRDTYDFGKYVAADINGSKNTLERRIKSSLASRTSAPILLIERTKLDRYNNAEKSGHYITVSGYAYEYATRKTYIKNVDPDWRSAYGGKYYNSLDEIYDAVYEAEQKFGGNKRMLY